MRLPTTVLVVSLTLAWTTAAQEPTTAEGYLKRGDDRLTALAIDNAIADYLRAIELDKKVGKELVGRAALISFFGEDDVALKLLDAVVSSGAVDADLYVLRGGISEKLGKPDPAIADYTSAIRVDPKSENAYAKRANTYSIQKKYAQAVADCDKMIELNPSASNYAFRAGIHERDRNNLKAAIADYTKVIELDPNAAVRYSSRANLYAQNNDSNSAIADLTTAIRLEPKSSYYFAARGGLYLKHDRLDDALADFNSALALFPNYHSYLLGRAEVERRKGDTERSTADFNKAIETGLWNAGKVYLYQLRLLPDVLNHDTAALIAEATTAIEKKPKDVEGYIRRAAMYHLSSDRKLFQKATDDYTAALKLAPERAAALHVCRGAVYQTLDRYASAVADYREALQLEPRMKLAETLLNAAIAKMTEHKTKTTLESVRLDQEIILVTNSFKEFTYPDGEKKEESNTLTVKREVTVADVRRLDVEVRASIKQKQESSTGSSSSTTSKETTTNEGGGSLGVTSFLSFSGRRAKSWESGEESGYSSTTLTGWESEFSTTVRKGVETSRTLSASVETTVAEKITVTGKGKDQPIRVIYLDKYRTGTAKYVINGVIDEVRFAFPVGKDITWEYVEKPKTEDKK